jgi:hypothetical protein
MEHILNNQMGQINWQSREQTIDSYYAKHPRKCPKCGSTSLGITYTTGTGFCGNCKSSLLLTASGLLAVQREKISENELGPCNLFFEDGTEVHCEKAICSAGPVFCGKVNHICL